MNHMVLGLTLFYALLLTPLDCEHEFAVGHNFVNHRCFCGALADAAAQLIQRYLKRYRIAGKHRLAEAEPVHTGEKGDLALVLGHA